MLKVTGILLAFIAFAAADKTTVDPDVATKQKMILQLLWHVHQPTTYKEIADVAEKWDLNDHNDRFTDTTVVKNWMDLQDEGTLPKGDVFDVHEEGQRKELIALFELMYFAKDFNTFYQTAAWARQNVNEGQFVHALCVAVIHRPDCQDLELPELHEISPYFYISATDIQTLVDAKLNGYRTYSVETNFSYLYDETNTEMLMSYFNEDINLNVYFTHVYLRNPFWMDHQKYGIVRNDNRGEQFYYIHQQLLAYQNLNRKSVDLPHVTDFDWERKVVKPGYNPRLRYQNGELFPARPDDCRISSIDTLRIADVKAIEYRVKEAINHGLALMKRGGFNVTVSTDVLGNIIEGNKDSVDILYYGSLNNEFRNLFALIVDPTDKHAVAPGPMSHFETALRDPAFYVCTKYINDLFVDYKRTLPAYKTTDLYIEGVQVKDVQVTDLSTFFEHTIVDVSSVVNGDSFFAQVSRLNHAPFTLKIKVDCKKTTSGVVRIFLGPKARVLHSNFYSVIPSFGEDYDLENLRHDFVELDHFSLRMREGENNIEVIFPNMPASTVDKHLFNKDVLKKIEDGTWTARTTSQSWRFPDNLLLPMGRVNGMPYVLYVMVSPHQLDNVDFSITGTNEVKVSHNRDRSRHVRDTLAKGFPFDREIRSFNQFYTPNMYFKDVHIYHK